MSSHGGRWFEQQLEAERALLVRTLEEHVGKYHQKVVCCISELVADMSENEKQQAPAQQTNNSVASAYVGNADGPSSSCAQEVQMEPINFTAAHMACGNKAPRFEGDLDVPNERSLTCDIAYDQKYLLGPPCEEPATFCTERKPRTGSSCQEFPNKHELTSLSPCRSPSSTSSSSPSQMMRSSFLPSTAIIPKEIQPRKQIAARAQNTFKGFFNNTHQRDPSVSRLRGCVDGATFDVITSAMVACCCVMMAVEVQYDGLQAGYLLGSPGYTEPASNAWPHTKMVLLVSDLTFNIFFSIEFVVRIAALRLDSFRSCWMYFDAALLVSCWLSYVEGLAVAVNPMILRLARLTRLGRLLKLLRNAQVIQTLFLLVRSIQASIACLIWSFSIIWFCQIIMAILMSQLLHPLFADESKDPDTRREVFKLFGTFARATLTMFELTLANWVPTTRLLTEKVSAWYGVLFVAYRCCFMFAIIKVITAVFIAETTRCASCDDELAVHKKQRQKEQYCAKLAEAFKHLDVDGDGVISWDEFEPLITNSMLRTWLTTLDIDTHDLMTLFHIYDRGDHQFDVNCFIDGLSHVKGPAKSIDVLKLLSNVDKLEQKLDNALRSLGT